MINSNYAKAYTEVLEIIKHLTSEEYSKIPKEQIEFFEKNMDKEYKYKINPEIDLAEQEISRETNAIIIKLFIDYFATEEQKQKIDKILMQNQLKVEEEKKTYNYNDIFKKDPKIKVKDEVDYVIEKFEDTKETSLIKYEKPFWVKLKEFIFKLFYKKEN